MSPQQQCVQINCTKLNLVLHSTHAFSFVCPTLTMGFSLYIDSLTT